MTGKEGGSVHFANLEANIVEHHNSLLKMCERLEKLADSLPNDYDSQECLSIAWQIYPMIMSAHKFEEEQLFPYFLTSGGCESGIDKSIERLRFEHWEDERSAEDVSMFLRELVQDPGQTNIDKISYVLRGFFEGLRRHIAFETEHLLPKLRAQ